MLRFLLNDVCVLSYSCSAVAAKQKGIHFRGDNLPNVHFIRKPNACDVFRVISCFMPCTVLNKAFLILLLGRFRLHPFSIRGTLPKAKECRQETGRVYPVMK